MSKRKWQNKALDNIIFLALLSLFYTTYYNSIFLNKLYQHGFKTLNIVLTVFLLSSSMFIFLIIFSFKKLLKPFLIILLLSSSLTYHFMDRYGIFIDVSVIKNLFETDFKESAEFITFSLIRELIVSSIIPSLVILFIPLKYEDSLMKSFLRKTKYVVVALLVFGLNFFIISDQLISLLRAHKELRYYIIPSNYISSLLKFSKKRLSKKSQLTSIGNDIKIDNKKLFVVLVVGESVRAKNWGLSGYIRDTNPLLSKTKNLFNFLDVSSCGTDTETSLPCMFSVYGRRNYDEHKIKTTQSLLHVLAKGGVEVIWIDNQSGDKGVARNIKFIKPKYIDRLCIYERCFDEVLVEELKDIIKKRKDRNYLVVLHMLGNHGPAYFKRYPIEFEYFKPSCRSEDLSKCSKQQIINTYDNIIRYTDFLLHKIIEILSKEKMDSLLIYISDHGESLGEKNIYLHGLPYFIAPQEQKKIPFIIWFSDNYIKKYKIECINTTTKLSLSHDNLFHIILGLYEAKTSVYNRELDFLSQCRK